MAAESVELSIDLSRLLALAVAAALLLFGRRLYWLAIGGLGFALGLLLTDAVLHLTPPLQLLAALAGGGVGIVLALVAQKVAIALAGVFGGAVLAWQLGGIWEAQLGDWIWGIVALGALLGAALASFLFDAVLIAASAIAGALVAVHVLDLTAPAEGWIFLGLVITGVLVQARNPPRRSVVRDPGGAGSRAVR